jgi:hypothetical protein
MFRDSGCEPLELNRMQVAYYVAISLLAEEGIDGEDDRAHVAAVIRRLAPEHLSTDEIVSRCMKEFGVTE